MLPDTLYDDNLALGLMLRQSLETLNSPSTEHSMPPSPEVFEDTRRPLAKFNSTTPRASILLSGMVERLDYRRLPLDDGGATSPIITDD